MKESRKASLLEEGAVIRAASQIVRRLEKQPDVARQGRTFVSLGILDAIEVPSDQILVGWRGLDELVRRMTCNPLRHPTPVSR